MLGLHLDCRECLENPRDPQKGSFAQNVAPLAYRFPRVFGDEFGEKFGEKFSDSLNLVKNVVTILVMNLVNHHILCQIQ